MSYNVDSCKVLMLDARIRADDAIHLRAVHDDDGRGFPESNFLDAIRPAAFRGFVTSEGVKARLADVASKYMKPDEILRCL